MLETLEIGPSGRVAGAVIWMHGLGASKHDFQPIVPLMGLPDVRFVLPQAPHQPVTINGGYQMPSWYDIRSLEPGPDREEEAGIRRSALDITALVAREVARGVPESRIVLAGFSQGGAMALHVGLRHPRPLLGVLVLSAYLVLEGTLEAESHPANAATAFLFCHGRMDETVRFVRGQHAYGRVKPGRNARFEPFNGGHEVVSSEVRVIRSWMRDRFVDADQGESTP